MEHLLLNAKRCHPPKIKPLPSYLFTCHDNQANCAICINLISYGSRGISV